MPRILQAQEARLIGGELVRRGRLGLDHHRRGRGRFGRLNGGFGDAARESPYRKHAKNDAKSPHHGRAE